MAGLKCLTFIYTIDKDMNNTACVLSCNAYVLTTQHTRASGVENKILFGVLLHSDFSENILLLQFWSAELLRVCFLYSLYILICFFYKCKYLFTYISIHLHIYI